MGGAEVGAVDEGGWAGVCCGLATEEVVRRLVGEDVVLQADGEGGEEGLEVEAGELEVEGCCCC